MGNSQARTTQKPRGPARAQAPTLETLKKTSQELDSLLLKVLRAFREEDYGEACPSLSNLGAEIGDLLSQLEEALKYVPKEMLTKDNREIMLLAKEMLRVLKKISVKVMQKLGELCCKEGSNPDACAAMVSLFSEKLSELAQDYSTFVEEVTGVRTSSSKKRGAPKPRP